MLTKTQMQQIQDLKLMGYTKTDIIRYYEARGEKPPSRPTISKYYDMDVVPDDPGAKLAKLKTFDSEPFRSTILRILETNSGKSFCMSSVYDVLEEKFIENGTYDKLPGNEQTLRNYIHYLEDEKEEKDAAKKVWKKYGKTLEGILESYLPGHRNEVAMHPNGLLWAQMDGVALSWMNTYVGGRPVTERAGYQVETNAMWYNAVCFALEMESRFGPKKKNAFIEKWSPIRDLIEENYQKTFWNYEAGYLADYVDNYGQNMDVRPNQLYAISLDYSPVEDMVKSDVVMTVNNELVTRRGIRTLSPRNVMYRGVYEGSQTDRDLAYYQGCSFPVLLDPYVNVCFKMMGPNFYKKAEYLTEGFYADINKHGVGAFSELYDGDPPHEAHGAIASACSTAALLRVDYLMNKYMKEE